MDRWRQYGMSGSVVVFGAGLDMSGYTNPVFGTLLMVIGLVGMAIAYFDKFPGWAHPVYFFGDELSYVLYRLKGDDLLKSIFRKMMLRPEGSGFDIALISSKGMDELDRKRLKKMISMGLIKETSIGGEQCWVPTDLGEKAWCLISHSEGNS